MIGTVVSLLLIVTSIIAANILLSHWSNSGTFKKVTDLDSAYSIGYYLGIFGAISISQALFAIAQSLFETFGCARASERLHMQLVKCVLRAELLFFDSTLLSRILTRFTKDIDAIDMTIPFQLHMVVTTLIDALASIILICISSPWYLIGLIPSMTCFLVVQRLYAATSRQLKRIYMIRKSPLLSHFQETLDGASSVRAYNRVCDFIQRSDKLIDECQMAWFPIIVSYRWLGVTIEILGHLITLIVCIIAVANRSSMGPALTGLAITFALKVSNSLTFVVRSVSDLENSLVSVERIGEFSRIKSEPDWRLGTSRTGLENWPSEGEIVFDNYCLRYRPDSQLVLKSINTVLPGGERIGIVGRTGAGKSSITMGLLRLVEPAGGRILIDGVDINSLGIHDLREIMTIIPQDPFIFSGTVRFNLDPLNQHSDKQLLDILEGVCLTDFLNRAENKLDFSCGEYGRNLSLGQRQLISLSRALLRQTPILVLDEPTASVDLITDGLIQEVMRTKFPNCTTIVIAHRIATVINYDRIIVLQDGKIVENDKPTVLLAKPDGVFYSMAKESGLI